MQTRSLSFAPRAAPARRILDIASGFALGIVLCFLISVALRPSPATVPVAPHVAFAASPALNVCVVTVLPGQPMP